MEKNPVSVSIPDELIFEILSYLPVKSLLRFRCVCKRWRFMISDASFVEAHGSRSAAALLFSVPDKSFRHWKYTLVSVQDGEARLPLVPGIDQFSCRNISQSVNGLVCIYEQYEKDYDSQRPIQSPRAIVYNPSTREHATLPPTTFTDVWRRYSQFISLGFDPSTNTYKILRENSCGGNHINNEIFTLGGGGGTWKIIKDGPIYGLTRQGICLNGTIYWAKNCTPVLGEDPNNGNVMVAFDVGEEKFREVPIPPDTRRWWDAGWGRTWNMIEIDGEIAVVDFHDMVESISDVMTIWKLKDSVNGIWTITRIVLPEFCISSSRFPYTMRRPFITSMDSGEITLIPNLLFRDWYVFHYNLQKENGRKEVISRPSDNYWNWRDDSFLHIRSVDCFNISVYKESLISPREICSL